MGWECASAGSAVGPPLGEQRRLLGLGEAALQLQPLVGPVQRKQVETLLRDEIWPSYLYCPSSNNPGNMGGRMLFLPQVVNLSPPTPIPSSSVTRMCKWACGLEQDVIQGLGVLSQFSNFPKDASQSTMLLI